jgi:hypothetical protein
MFNVRCSSVLFSIKLVTIAASGWLKSVISPRYPICSLLQYSTFRIPWPRPALCESFLEAATLRVFHFGAINRGRRARAGRIPNSPFLLHSTLRIPTSAFKYLCPLSSVLCHLSSVLCLLPLPETPSDRLN